MTYNEIAPSVMTIDEINMVSGGVSIGDASAFGAGAGAVVGILATNTATGAAAGGAVGAAAGFAFGAGFALGTGLVYLFGVGFRSFNAR